MMLNNHFIKAAFLSKAEPVKCIVAIFILALVASCATLAGVNEPGEPPDFDDRAALRYEKYIDGAPNSDMRTDGGLFIWRTGNTWHVRMARKHPRVRQIAPSGPVVTGGLRVDNAVVHDFVKHEMGPFNSVWQRINDIEFRFDLREETGRDIEGFDFKLRPIDLEYCVTLDVMVDGEPRPGIVRLGSFMHSPEMLPLEICSRSSGVGGKKTKPVDLPDFPGPRR